MIRFSGNRFPLATLSSKEDHVSVLVPSVLFCRPALLAEDEGVGLALVVAIVLELLFNVYRSNSTREHAVIALSCSRANVFS